MTIKELAVDHPYYCSESNYYSNEASCQYDTWKAFEKEMGDADIDMNLCFRWDIQEKQPNDVPTGEYRMYVFIIHQRKGIFAPQTIETVTDADVPGIVRYLEKNCERLMEMWKPIALDVWASLYR